VIYTGDCIEAMAAMEPESIDAVCTDPPYGLEFMGKAWDKLGATVEHPDDGEGPWGRTKRVRYGRSAESAQSWHEAWADAALRVAKPGAYLLAFGGTRTVHRMTCAIEDAGWIIRDMLVWAYASGFPKGRANLKPAWEPIVMARKLGPLRPLAIDACRISTSDTSGWSQTGSKAGPNLAMAGPNGDRDPKPDNALGRWPANVILTDPIFDGGWDGVVGGGEAAGSKPVDWTTAAERASFPVGREASVFYDDSGTYSRFFIIPKAARSDREPVVRGQLDAEPGRWGGTIQDGRPHMPEGYEFRPKPRENGHPTVKPTDLMRHLVRLVTPPGGTVLDPFLGSGTTALAAEMEGFAWIGIEKEAEYVEIAEARLNGTQKGMAL